MEDGLSVIIMAIRISRSVFQRLRNYMIFRITESAQLLLFFFFAIICILPPDFLGPEEKTYVTNKLGLGQGEIPKSFMIPVIALVLIPAAYLALEDLHRGLRRGVERLPMPEHETG